MADEDGDPPKKTPSRKSKTSKKSKKPKVEEVEEPPKQEEPAPSPIIHEPEVKIEAVMPPPRPTPSVGQLQQKPCIRDFWVCWGMLFIFALVCGIGFAVLHVTMFMPGKPRHHLMTANRIHATHGMIPAEHGK